MSDLLPDEIRALVVQLGHRDWKVRANAQRLLKPLKEYLEPYLIEGLSHPTPRVRVACADWFDHLGEDSCVAPLTRVLHEDSVPRVRRQAIHSLGCDRCKESALSADRIPLLLETMRTDPSISVRREAVHGLRMALPDPRALAALRDILAIETDRLMVGYAHRGLYAHDKEYRAACIARCKALQSAQSGI